jgi:hypothetical protein
MQLQQTLDVTRTAKLELAKQLSFLQQTSQSREREQESEVTEKMQVLLAERQSLEQEFARQQERAAQAKHEETLLRETQAKQRAVRCLLCGIFFVMGDGL